MSYILDALNKADKERKQSETPASGIVIAAEPTAQSKTMWFVVPITISLLVILWFIFQAKETVKPVVSPVSVAPTQTPVKPETTPAKLEATIQTTTTFIPIKPQEIKEEPQPIPNIMGLDQALRNRLPAISISAHVFSHDATKRMVIINQQVLHEGDYIAADLSLTSIGQHGIELIFHDERFTMKVKDKWPRF